MFVLTFIGPDRLPTVIKVVERALPLERVHPKTRNMKMLATSSYLLLALVFFCAHSRSTESPQDHPASFTDPNQRQEVREEAFVQFIHSNKHLNQHIPASAPAEGMRIVTWNLHYFRDGFDKKSTLNEILWDVKEMGADVYLFEEVHMDTSKPDRHAFDSGLTALGYRWQHVRGAPGSILGQMIASRFPLSNLGYLELGYQRIMIEAELALENNGKLALFAGHWQNADNKAREMQARMTIDHIKRNGSASFIFGADFNAVYSSEAIQTLASSGLLKNSFDVLQWQHPNVTCWSGREIDFIWVSNEIEKHVVGTYLYYTLSSDHLPIIMDLDLQPQSFD